MKYILRFSIFLFYLNKGFSQKIYIDSNISKIDLLKYNFYSNISRFENKNYFFIGYSSIYPLKKGVLLQLNNKHKVKKIYSFETILSNNIKTNNNEKEFFSSQSKKVNLGISFKKKLSKRIKSIKWNAYFKDADSNYNCESILDSINFEIK